MAPPRLTTVLAFHVGHPADVLVAAEALAFALGASVRLAVLGDGQDLAAAIGDELADTSVVACVMPLDPDIASGQGSTRPSILAASERPLILVPRHARLPRRGRFERVLLPLEGTVETSDAVGGVVADLARHGASIIAVHVFHEATTPPFWDQSGHASETWATEFLDRWFDVVDVDLHLRRGDVGAALLELAAVEQVDLVALGWNRVLTPDRAATVRAVLAATGVPVLLAPTGAAPRP